MSDSPLPIKITLTLKVTGNFTWSGKKDWAYQLAGKNGYKYKI